MTAYYVALRPLPKRQTATHTHTYIHTQIKLLLINTQWHWFYERRDAPWRWFRANALNCLKCTEVSVLAFYVISAWVGTVYTVYLIKSTRMKYITFSITYKFLFVRPSLNNLFLNRSNLQVLVKISLLLLPRDQFPHPYKTRDNIISPVYLHL